MLGKHSGVISSFSLLVSFPFPLMEFSLEGGDVADELVVLLDKIEETENMLGFFGTIGVVVIVSCNL